MRKHSRFALCILVSILLSRCANEDIGTCTPDKIKLSVINETGPSSCSTQDISFTITATGGTEPYTYEVNTGQTTLTQGGSSFSRLFPGKVRILVRDKFNCTATLDWDTTLDGPPPVSFKDHVAPILSANCNLSGCHNGSLGADRDWTSVSAIQLKLNHFQRILTLQKMPPPPNRLLNKEELDKVLCWIAHGAPNN